MHFHRLVFRFRDLQNYTTLKQPIARKVASLSFRDLQNYTTLKLPYVRSWPSPRFRDLQNYTTLKQSKR